FVDDRLLDLRDEQLKGVLVGLRFVFVDPVLESKLLRDEILLGSAVVLPLLFVVEDPFEGENQRDSQADERRAYLGQVEAARSYREVAPRRTQDRANCRRAASLQVPTLHP